MGITRDVYYIVNPCRKERPRKDGYMHHDIIVIIVISKLIVNHIIIALSGYSVSFELSVGRYMY
jgi:hypothetical protein